MPEYRALTASDAEAVAGIEAISFSRPWSENAVKDFLAAGGFGFAAREGETLLGYVLARCAAGEGEIANLAVLPALRRKGIGTALLLSLKKEVRARGGEALFLEVRASNLAARRLYERNGFTEVGVRRAFYTAPTEDGILYKSEL